MVITVLQCGLGNQLFQYATGRAVAERLGASLLLDATHFAYITLRDLDIRKLRIRARWLPDGVAKLLTKGCGANFFKTWMKTLAGMGIHHFADASTGYDPRILDAGRFCRLDGFWQSEQYFAHLRPALIDELEPREGLPGPVAAFAERIASEESIALHVRRGDLVTDRRYAETVGALTADYYHRALESLKSRLPNARVYLFSDDLEWCDKHIPHVFPTEIVSGRVTRSAVEDLTVMKRCRHFVIANSTFSWWAAWLGNDPAKQVIAPARFFRVPRTWERDLLPTTWETFQPIFEEAG